MIDIPCIKDKCLLLPICKSKETIDCNDLLIWFYEIRRINRPNDMKYILKQYYPHLKRLFYINDINEETISTIEIQKCYE
jgi:hypothetical protein